MRAILLFGFMTLACIGQILAQDSTENTISKEQQKERSRRIGQSHYVGVPTGYGFRKRDFSYKNYMLLFNSIKYGISDDFSVGAGFVFPFYSGEEVPVWLTLSYSKAVNNDHFKLKTNLFAFNVFNDGFFALAQTVGMTHTSEKKMLSFSFGYAMQPADEFVSPLVEMSGLLHLGKIANLIIATYALPPTRREDGVLFGSATVRWLSRRVHFDTGLLFATELDNNFSLAVPLLGISVPYSIKPKKAKD